MTFVPGSPLPQEVAWARGEAETIAAMGAINAATASLVSTIGMPGQFHLGGPVPDSVARYLGCDADVVINAYRAGQLLGITPATRTPPRALRRYLERRDGGCVHPLCEQKAWLHMHHLVHWEANGPTDAYNLCCLCPLHHRALHHGDFTIDGNPETGTLVFTDSRGQRIEPPATGPPTPAPRPSPHAYTPPHGERTNLLWFGWN